MRGGGRQREVPQSLGPIPDLFLCLQGLKARLQALGLVRIRLRQLAREVVKRFAVLGIDLNHLPPLCDCAGPISGMQKFLTKHEESVRISWIEFCRFSKCLNCCRGMPG